MNKRRYYWLRLKEDFFRQREIKRLRRIAGGDTYTIIYLKLLLLGIQTDGTIYFEGFEDSFAEELALELDEEDDNVEVTLSFLMKHGLAEMVNDHEMLITETSSLTGSESKSAERVRKHREKQKVLQCNAKLLQSNTNVTDCNGSVTKCNTEREREKEKEKEKELEIEERGGGEKLTHSSLMKINQLWNKTKNQDIDLLIYKNRVDLIAEKYGEENIIKAIKQIENSEYLQRKDVCSITWFLTEEKFEKILAGDYGDFNKESKDTTKKTSFHNFENNSTNYTNEELEKVWGSK